MGDLTIPYLIEVDGQLVLNRKHDYYYQVQGQMFCTGKQTCDFFIYTFKDSKIITVHRNEEFITEMIGSLTVFYDKYFKKKVLEKLMYSW